MLLLLGGYGIVEQTVHEAAYGGHGRSQLVADVRYEAVSHGVVGLERSRHFVECRREVVVFALGVFGELNIEIAASDLFRRVRHLLYGRCDLNRGEVYYHHRDNEHDHRRKREYLHDIPRIVIIVRGRRDGYDEVIGTVSAEPQPDGKGIGIRIAVKVDVEGRGLVSDGVKSFLPEGIFLQLVQGIVDLRREYDLSAAVEHEHIRTRILCVLIDLYLSRFLPARGLVYHRLRYAFCYVRNALFEHLGLFGVEVV